MSTPHSWVPHNQTAWVRLCWTVLSHGARGQLIMMMNTAISRALACENLFLVCLFAQTYTNRAATEYALAQVGKTVSSTCRSAGRRRRLTMTDRPTGPPSQNTHTHISCTVRAANMSSHLCAHGQHKLCEHYPCRMRRTSHGMRCGLALRADRPSVCRFTLARKSVWLIGSRLSR